MHRQTDLHTFLVHKLQIEKWLQYVTWEGGKLRSYSCCISSFSISRVDGATIVAVDGMGRVCLAEESLNVFELCAFCVFASRKFVHLKCLRQWQRMVLVTQLLGLNTNSMLFPWLRDTISIMSYRTFHDVYFGDLAVICSAVQCCTVAHFAFSLTILTYCALLRSLQKQIRIAELHTVALARPTHPAFYDRDLRRKGESSSHPRFLDIWTILFSRKLANLPSKKSFTLRSFAKMHGHRLWPNIFRLDPCPSISWCRDNCHIRTKQN